MKKNKYQEMYKCSLQKDKIDERDFLFQSEMNIDEVVETIRKICQEKQ